MDEEGESSYKSEAAPRYHTREIAKFRCVEHQALLLLASATPSVESRYKAQRGAYHYFELKERYAAADLPEVFLVDMREEERQANMTALSRMLQGEIQKNLERGEQTILFINRRGYQTAMQCVDCGEAVKCPHCDAALTYHRDNGYMMCHYCGYSARPPRECPACGGRRLKLTGLGTQKLQEELESLFPQARVLRMDTDTTYSRYAYGESFEAFGRREYDILLGTQMIAKGLDFPNVTLVGVLNADAGLYAPDYDRKGIGLSKRDLGGGAECRRWALRPGLPQCGAGVFADHPSGGAERPGTKKRSSVYSNLFAGASGHQLCCTAGL